MSSKQTVAIGITGGIAAYKVPELVSRLVKKGFDIEVIMTEAATQLVAPLAFSTLSGHPVRCEMFKEKVGERVEHIAIADRADLLVIVPATANIIGKAANGIADDLLSTTIMAAAGPVMYFPAMNTRMWEHPVQQENIAKLRSLGFEVVDPDEGFLACGTSGKGRLGSIDMIEQRILESLAALKKEQDLAGKKVLISAGPTVEDIDPVRFISNRSSGKMGYALAKAATCRGASVTLVSGPVSLSAPVGVELHKVRSAAEMQEKMEQHYKAADITIMAAAVADYHLRQVAKEKIKKTTDSLVLELERNPDILASLGQKKQGFLVGFAAETESLQENAVAKLEKKKLDMIIANDVSAKDAGFGTDTNIVTIIEKNRRTELPKMSKEAVANAIFDAILTAEEKIK